MKVIIESMSEINYPMGHTIIDFHGNSKLMGEFKELKANVLLCPINDREVMYLRRMMDLNLDLYLTSLNMGPELPVSDVDEFLHWKKNREKVNNFKTVLIKRG